MIFENANQLISIAYMYGCEWKQLVTARRMLKNSLELDFRLHKSAWSLPIYESWVVEQRNQIAQEIRRIDKALTMMQEASETEEIVEISYRDSRYQQERRNPVKLSITKACFQLNVTENQFRQAAQNGDVIKDHRVWLIGQGIPYKELGTYRNVL